MSRNLRIILIVAGLTVLAVAGYLLRREADSATCSRLKDANSCTQVRGCRWGTPQVDCGFSPLDVCYPTCYSARN